MRSGNKDDALYCRIRLEDEREFDQRVGRHLSVESISLRFKLLVPDDSSGVSHLHSRQEAAHAVTDEDNLLKSVKLLRVSKVIAQQVRRVGNRVACRIGKCPELIVMANFWVRRQGVNDVTPDVRGREQAMHK